MITCENLYLASIPIMPSFFRFVLVIRLHTHKLFFFASPTTGTSPAFVKQDVLEKACNGKYASVSRVEGAGHLVSSGCLSFRLLFDTFP